MRKEIIKIYKKAEFRGFAIGAFNFSTNDILKGIIRAARNLRAPIIISTSEGERNFFGLESSVAIYHSIKKQYPYVILHADHTHTLAEIKKVIDAGYPSVHFDGSHLPYEENLKQTMAAVTYAHKHQVFIEGELGGIPGGSSLHKESLKSILTKDMMTDPAQAEEFAKMTGVDSLAVNIGNAHGIWKDAPKLDFKRLEEIKKRTKKFLVLHGGSGITAKDFRKAIEIGIDKININTEIRLAYEKALIKGLKERKDDTPYNYLGQVADAVQNTVEKNIIIFKSERKV